MVCNLHEPLQEPHIATFVEHLADVLAFQSSYPLADLTERAAETKRSDPGISIFITQSRRGV